MSGSTESIALVLAGGGARGAYEAGALSVLLPELDRRGQRPRIIVGTSVGALNASFLAANVDRPTGELVEAALSIWASIRWPEVVEHLLSPSTIVRFGEYAGEVLGLPGVRIDSLLDPEPLRVTLRERIDFARLRRNVEEARLESAAVVATSAHTSRSVVFHTGLPSPPPDRRRGIDYVASELAEAHVLASAAIPAVFPSVHIEHPRSARGWYSDGGTRLNTPIKPALALGATRVVVVALGSLDAGPRRLADGQQPDALAGAGAILSALLDDQLTADLHTLTTINELVGNRGEAKGKRRVPYIVIAPKRRDTIARRALEVMRRHYAGALQQIRSPDIALLSRLVAGGSDVQHAELLSFLLFAPEFARALIRLGQEDARRWIAQPHELERLWQVGRL
jgi:NTE family protein